MNEIEKKAEQLFDDIRMLKGQYNVRLAAGLNDRAKSMKDLAIDLILQFAREIAQAQREKDLSYLNHDIFQVYGKGMEDEACKRIRNTPLIIDKTE